MSPVVVPPLSFPRGPLPTSYQSSLLHPLRSLRTRCVTRHIATSSRCRSTRTRSTSGPAWGTKVSPQASRSVPTTTSPVPARPDRLSGTPYAPGACAFATPNIRLLDKSAHQSRDSAMARLQRASHAQTPRTSRWHSLSTIPHNHALTRSRLWMAIRRTATQPRETNYFHDFGCYYFHLIAGQKMSPAMGPA